MPHYHLYRSRPLVKRLTHWTWILARRREQPPAFATSTEIATTMVAVTLILAWIMHGIPAEGVAVVTAAPGCLGLQEVVVLPLAVHLPAVAIMVSVAVLVLVTTVWRQQWLQATRKCGRLQ